MLIQILEIEIGNPSSGCYRALPYNGMCTELNCERNAASRIFKRQKMVDRNGFQVLGFWKILENFRNAN